MPLPARLRRLPRVEVAALPGLDVRLARDPLARLLGLGGLRDLPSATGLLLPRTRSVHTLGMRFPLDLVWLGRDGDVVRIDRTVAPGRVRACRAARAVVEVRSGADA